jgi:hypothetical protein
MNYTTADGEEYQEEISKDIDQLILRNKEITTIDLSSLADCQHLRVLDLSMNQIRWIDLNPLKTLTDIRSVNLFANQLEGVNLDPLRTSTELQFLNLSQNSLDRIDLSPLHSCLELKSFTIVANPLETIDLTPLGSCKNLSTLEVSCRNLNREVLDTLGSFTNLVNLTLFSDYLQTIDLTPLCSLHSLRFFTLRTAGLDRIEVTSISRVHSISVSQGIELASWVKINIVGSRFVYFPPTHTYPWNFIYPLFMSSEKNYRIQFDVLAALGLADFGFVDCNLIEKLESFSLDESTSDIQATLSTILSECILVAVSRKGPTTGLNLERLALMHGDVAARIQDIVEQRKSEIENIRISYNEHNVVDLKNLWLTAHGFDILTALGMNLTADEKQLEDIQKLFASLDLELRVSESPTSIVNMSDELKECIWWRVKNKGKNWENIE